jgi:hypothetical protein
MIKSIGILVFVALASMVVGVLLGFLLYYWWPRIQKRRQDLFLGKITFNTTKTDTPLSVTPVQVGIVKLKVPKQEVLEITVENHKRTVEPDIPKEVVAHSQKITQLEEKQKGLVKMRERHEESPQSEMIRELETNFTIASMPWADKLLPFQTRSWDLSSGEDVPVLNAHFQELINLYVDISLANNIVWMATEIGHRDKELDESYTKLCKVIGERSQRLISLLGSV